MRTRSHAVLFAVAALALTGLQFGTQDTAAAAADATGPTTATPPSYLPLRTASHGPFDLALNNMDYNGGPVMPSNTDYLVLWSPAGSSAYPAGFVTGISRFFQDLAHDSGTNQNVDSVSAQYNDLTGAFARYSTTFGGALVDRDPYPTSQCPVNAPVTNCITNAQIQKELEHYVVAKRLKTDLSHEYFLLTPPHVEGCFSSNAATSYGGCTAGELPTSLAKYCAYHENTSRSPLLFYADDPYVVGNPGCDDGNHPNGPYDGELSGGLSHKQNESVSDPIPNDAWTNGAGANQGQEIGDQCNFMTGTALGSHNGALYNQVINTHFYWFQEEWSNQGHACLQRLTPATQRPVARFTVTAGTGLTLKFNASGSSAAGGVAHYVWQFNDAFGAQTVERSTPSVAHTFPSAGAYSVGLTVVATDGTSTGTGGIVTTGRSGFTVAFTYTPAAPVHGQAMTFSALTTVSAKPVLTYLWEFGDGSTGSGPSPAHAYSVAGTYMVTVVMFSGVGSAFPGAGAAPVATVSVTVS